MITEIAAWLILALGVGHTTVALMMFGKPLLAAVSEGYWNRFKADKARTHGFWFLLFGPMLIFLGYLCVVAVQTDNHQLMRLLGGFIFVLGLAGALAFPKSPFWAAVVLAPLILMAGLQG